MEKNKNTIYFNRELAAIRANVHRVGSHALSLDTEVQRIDAILANLAQRVQELEDKVNSLMSDKEDVNNDE